jgi:hypothetical protein
MNKQPSQAIHVVRVVADASEGGSVRDRAFHRCFSQKDWISTIALGNSRLRNVFRILRLIFFRRRVLLLHISSPGLPILNNSLIGRLACKLYSLWLNHVARRNIVYLEFNDLFVEQSKDLEFTTPRNFAKIENKIYVIPGLHFVFASESMRAFACDKHKLPTEMTLAIPNGEFQSSEVEPAEEPIASNPIEYVYAGTLNKGRAIEQLIEIFNGSSANLTLIGTHGEWIAREYNLPENVRYLPSISGEKLPAFLHNFDVGLIPYPSDRQYYHIAYPTKLSTYVVSGLTFLATPVKEVERTLSLYPQIGFARPIEAWHEFIQTCTREEIYGAKLAASQTRENFSWERQFAPLMDQIQHALTSNPIK